MKIMASTPIRPADTQTGEMQYHENILGTLGNTPLVRLHTVTRGLKPLVLAKVESFNPGGSVKDRIGLAIIEDYERSGQLKPGGTVVEATSGNTGVGLAIAAAIKGYKTVFVMPDKQSMDKVQLLRAYGARVVITPTAVEPDDPRSYYSVARRIVEETPGSVLANQYHNPVNPQVHYETTGPELWEQTAGKIDVFVAGMGTGGTITGVGRFLKEKNANIQIVGADPVGSILYDVFHTGKANEAFSYRIEGIGEDFVPSIYDMSVMDDVVRVEDRESLLMARRLVREEGIFCGGSSGAAVVGALRYIQKKKLGEDKTVVILLPDSGSRYLSKVFNDDWMREMGFFGQVGCDASVAEVLKAKPQQEMVTISADARMTDVIGLMKSNGISQAPVIHEGELLGVVREIDLLNHMLMGGHEHTAEETIGEIIQRNVRTVTPDASLDHVMGMFLKGDDVVLVVPGNGKSTSSVMGILTKIDILDYIATHCM
jgi:cystathionine beta-synthase